MIRKQDKNQIGQLAVPEQPKRKEKARPRLKHKLCRDQSSISSACRLLFVSSNKSRWRSATEKCTISDTLLSRPASSMTFCFPCFVASRFNLKISSTKYNNYLYYLCYLDILRVLLNELLNVPLRSSNCILTIYYINYFFIVQPSYFEHILSITRPLGDRLGFIHLVSDNKFLGLWLFHHCIRTPLKPVVYKKNLTSNYGLVCS